MERKITKLGNNIEVIYKQNPNTPRAALSFNYSLNVPESTAGLYLIMARLFTQGTKTRSAAQIAQELDRYAIEFTSELKQDFLRFKFVCLNEDFPKAVEITEDIIKNTTFEDFEREAAKTEGEIIAELDAPRMKALDNYFKNIFEGHHYGNTHTKILENIKKLKREDVINAYKTFTQNSRKVIVFAGGLPYDDVYGKLNAAFGNIHDSNEEKFHLEVPALARKKECEIIKSGLNQAHIIQGWLVPTFEHEDSPALLLLNIILGASGLSSRLFLELRDKKGLAYVVRSSYETSAMGANFSIYIATEPKNIQVSLDGFKDEIQKLKDIPVSEKELNDAKNNLIGKWAFSRETNLQQAALTARNAVIGIGADYHDKLEEKIKLVTPDDILRCANKYFNNEYVLSIVKP
ncbi:MAG: insulinase family protein [Heliobacteriaceae bacterium]|jgi:predicted Zn-dependent peptidase|nr:insulinase family protein [Heliobacteriaceae bacterium]